MGKIAIVTDSTADLGSKAEAMGVTVVPLNVHFGDEQFKDGVNLSPEEFYVKLASSPVMPRTSQPSPGDFVDVYGKLAASGVTDIISIHLSAALSGTYQSAEIAKNIIEDDVSIHLFDSQLASLGLGVIVTELATRLSSGADVESLLKVASTMREKTALFFAVDTLEYLEKNGRIGKAQGLLGSLLQIKPVLTLDSGVVSPFDKLRGKKRVIPRLVDLMAERVPAGAGTRLAVAHGNSPAEAANLSEQLQSKFPETEIGVDSIGPVIGSHTGPGVLAVIGVTVE